MRLSERDLQIMRWINSHKYATQAHIANYFKLSVPATEKRINELVNAGYLFAQQVFTNLATVYNVSPKGVLVAGDSLKAVKRIRDDTFSHDLLLVDLAIALERNVGGKWYTGRQIRNAINIISHEEASGRVPDGVILTNGYYIAVELETTSKGLARRLNRDLWFYSCQDIYKKIWFVCMDKEIADKIGSLTKRNYFVKTYLLKEII